MGPLSYFMGIKIIPKGKDITSSQSKYINELLERICLSNSKLVPSRITSTLNLSLWDSSPFSDPIKYHQTVGALQYVTMSRPDITYVVNKVC